MNQVVHITMSLENRRRAVYTALIEHFGDNELWAALAHWEDKYSADASFSPQKFLSDILDTAELRGKRVRILQSLVKSMSAPPATLLQDPREQLLVYRMQNRSASVAANSRDPLVGAFASLLTRILANIDADNRLRMRLYMMNQAERSKTAPATRTAVRNWLAEQSRLSLASADPQDLRRLLNIAYVGLCEYIGPVAADAALNRAFTQLGAEEPDLQPHARTLL